MSEFNKVRNMFLGFDNLFSEYGRSTPDYPPTDIYYEKDITTIKIAVAGFNKDNLKVVVEDNTLKIVGDDQKYATGNYGVMGISKKGFSRLYKLGDGVQVKRAKLKDGLLTIEVNSLEPQKQIKNIEIE